MMGYSVKKGIKLYESHDFDDVKGILFILIHAVSDS